MDREEGARVVATNGELERAVALYRGDKRDGPVERVRGGIDGPVTLCGDAGVGAGARGVV
jgi:hypothetical protein